MDVWLKQHPQDVYAALQSASNRPEVIKKKKKTSSVEVSDLEPRYKGGLNVGWFG